MKYLTFLIFFNFISCTTFTPYARFNIIQNCEDQGYRCVINDSLHLNYKSFGGFQFANTIREYRNMKVKNRPKFKNVIVYGRSKVLEGDYYLILNNEMTSDHFQFKDTIINGQKITVALSKTIDYKSDTDFILNFNPNKESN